MSVTMSEKIQAENWNIAQLVRLGLPGDIATRLTNEGFDYHDLDTFLKYHPTCDPVTAIAIIR